MIAREISELSMADVWIIRGYGGAESSTKFLDNLGGFSFIPSVLDVDDEFVLGYFAKGLVLCNMKEGTLRKIIVHGLSQDFWYVYSFVDSFVSPSQLASSSLTEERCE